MAHAFQAEWRGSPHSKQTSYEAPRPHKQADHFPKSQRLSLTVEQLAVGVKKHTCAPSTHTMQSPKLYLCRTWAVHKSLPDTRACKMISTPTPTGDNPWGLINLLQSGRAHLHRSYIIQMLIIRPAFQQAVWES